MKIFDLKNLNIKVKKSEKIQFDDLLNVRIKKKKKSNTEKSLIRDAKGVFFLKKLSNRKYEKKGIS